MNGTFGARRYIASLANSFVSCGRWFVGSGANTAAALDTVSRIKRFAGEPNFGPNHFFKGGSVIVKIKVSVLCIAMYGQQSPALEVNQCVSDVGKPQGRTRDDGGHLLKTHLPRERKRHRGGFRHSKQPDKRALIHPKHQAAQR